MTYREQSYFIATVLAISAAIFLVIICGVNWAKKNAVTLAGPYVSERLPNTYRFEPKPDITTYELALSLAPMLGSTDFVDRMKPFYEAMPPNVRRHWLPLSPKVDH